MNNFRKHICIVDLEATCYEDHGKRDLMEIIEIGAVMVDNPDLNKLSTFQSFVRPHKNPKLSDFCKNLTSITQEQVSDAQSFPEVLEKFQAWIDGYGRDDVTFASWGFYDYGQFDKDCTFHGSPFPFTGQHLNIKEYVSIKKGWGKKGVSKICERLGLQFEGTQHRGIDDALMIHKILQKIGV